MSADVDVEALRDRIIASLRARGAAVHTLPAAATHQVAADWWSAEILVKSCAGSELESLRALAAAVGLAPDGSDPTEAAAESNARFNWVASQLIWQVHIGETRAAMRSRVDSARILAKGMDHDGGCNLRGTEEPSDEYNPCCCARGRLLAALTIPHAIEPQAPEPPCLTPREALFVDELRGRLDGLFERLVATRNALAEARDQAHQTRRARDQARETAKEVRLGRRWLERVAREVKRVRSELDARVAEEREACALAAEDEARQWHGFVGGIALRVARAIRARGGR